MRSFPLLVLGLLLGWSPVKAQFGLSGQFLQGQASDWETALNGPDGQPSLELPGTGWQASIDYWFRLKNTRIEFLPTLAYSRQAVSSPIFGNENQDLTAQAGHFFFNTNIYLLDLQGDCDCPTWSKEGPTLEKGLFLQLSPGLSYYALSNATSQSDSDLALNVGLGIGFDIGVSDFLTITPLIQARYYPEVYWTAFEGPLPERYDGLAAASELWQYSAGIRLGFRLNP